MRQQARQRGSAIRAVLAEISRNSALDDALQVQFLHRRKSLIQHILRQAVERGEIEEPAIDDELWDLLPGYILFRSVISGRPPTQRTVQALVDHVLIPSLKRPKQ